MKMRYNIIISSIVLLLALKDSAANVDLKAQLEKCRADLKSLDSCLASLIRDIEPLLTKGIPELNIPVLEPINLQNLEFAQREGPVNIRAKFTNVYVHGLSNMSVADLRTNLDKRELQLRVTIPILRVTGNYVLDGNLLLLPIPITGNGPFRSSLHDIDAGVVSQIVVKNEQGSERLGIENTRINFKLGSARTKLKNLFNGDQFLGDTVNHFINSNDQMILKEIKPAVSRDVALLIQSLMDNALSTLPVSLIRP